MEILSRFESEIELQLGDEEDRRKGIDSRLVPFLPLAGVMATILTASVPVVVSSGFAGLEWWEVAIVVFPASYVGSQVFRCLNTAISGLGRRTYETVGLDELTPRSAETPGEYRNRILAEKRGCLVHNRWVNNSKSDHLWLAQRALQNAVAGAVLLLFAASFLGFRAHGQEGPATASTTGAASPTAAVSPLLGTPHPSPGPTFSVSPSHSVPPVGSPDQTP